MKIDLIVAEIGSTTTVVNAFTDLGSPTPRFLGQGYAETSMAEGDVTLGLRRATESLARRLGVEVVDAREMYATSSAAGGLSMTVHGLVPEMTVKAAREAALGSGAVLRMVTAGKLRPYDLERVRELAPRIIMIAGGVDGGERATALHNFEVLSDVMPTTPMLYAGNADNLHEIRAIAEQKGVLLYTTANVYPSLDTLNVTPARNVIQEIFEEHIVEAPGMAHIRDMVTGSIMPTPGAVMAMAEAMEPIMGDLMALDVGGATTDVHSVTEGSEALHEYQLDPEPFSKRTVEGDLGVFVNRDHVLDAMKEHERRALPQGYDVLLRAVGEIPDGAAQIALITPLVETCCREAIHRHAGRMVELFTTRGRQTVVRGRDMTAVEHVIATGGALTRLPHMADMLRALLESFGPDRLFPPSTAEVWIDRDYIMASCGVMAREHPAAAVRIFRQSLMKT
ncbi:MAG: glutamate mutase L [Saccharofermentanales bacterium]|jgi:uncharacterized protein (TIGR01319 family)